MALAKIPAKRAALTEDEPKVIREARELLGLARKLVAVIRRISPAGV